MKAETLSWHACDLEGSVSARFERVAARFPGKAAIRSGTEAITYDALNRAADRVAHAALGRASSQQPIAVLLEHGASPVVAILGVLKAGTFYIALNPSHPCSHLQNILADAGASLIVTNSRNLDLARQLAADESGILNIDTIPGEVPDTNRRISSDAEGHFGLFYTSGSAGQPKGILHNHRHILHRAMILAEAYRLGPTDRIPLAISCTWLSRTELRE